MSQRERLSTAAREYVKAPAHILTIAAHITYDLLHGPTMLRVPGGDVTKIDGDCLATYADDLDANESDVVESTYCGIAADTLRTYIRETLPGTIYIDLDCESVSDSEPEGYLDEDSGEYFEPDYSSFVRWDPRAIVSAVFGQTIANEFDW